MVRKRVQVKLHEQVINGLCTHLGDELIGVGIIQICIILGQLVQNIQVFILREEIKLAQRSISILLHHTRLNHHITFVIDDRVKFLGGNAQEVTYLVGQGTEIPYMCHGHNQLDMTTALATNFLLGHFHSTAVTDDTLIADALVLSAMALVVLGGTENALAEETVALGLVGTVVDGFGLGNLTPRIFQNLLGRGKTDGNLREIVLYFIISFESHKFLS